MELSGSIYLYALATVSITFAAFSALLLVLRQTMGGAPTRYEGYFTLSFMQLGFLVTGGSLLPPALALYGLSPTTVWRIASITMAIPVLLFIVTLPRRRRAASHDPIPRYLWILLFVQLLIVLYLLLNAMGKPVAPGIAAYAAAMTGLLFTSVIAYLLALAVALREPARAPHRE